MRFSCKDLGPKALIIWALGPLGRVAVKELSFSYYSRENVISVMCLPLMVTELKVLDSNRGGYRSIYTGSVEVFRFWTAGTL